MKISYASIVLLIVGAVVVLGLAANFSRELLENDAAQYIDTAIHMAGGFGPATSLIYYDQHYAFGAIPAPQTVFPWGMSALIAIPLWAGVDSAWSLLLVSLVSFVSIGSLTFLLLRRHIGDWAACGAGVFWFLMPVGWYHILIGNSEIAFTAVSLASAAALVDAEAGTRSALLRAGIAGLLAAVAVSIRYQGVFLLVALGAYLLQQHSRHIKTLIEQGLLVIVPPVLVFTGMAVRNLRLVGNFTGGPSVTVDDTLSGHMILQELYWDFSRILGLEVPQLQAFAPAEWMVVLGACGGAVALYLGGALASSTKECGASVVRTDQRLGVFCACYTAATLIGLAALAATRSADYLQDRYLLCIIPFATVLLWLVAGRFLRRVGGRTWQAVLTTSIAFLAGGVALGQRTAFGEYAGDLAQSRGRIISAALTAPIGHQDVRAYLRDLPPEEAIFSAQAQLTGLLLERSVLGAAPYKFSSVTWDQATVAATMRAYGARHLLVYPSLFDDQQTQNINRPLFGDLIRGLQPGWTPLLRSGHIHVYILDPVPEPSL